jgi:hypothetical protein
MTAIVAERLDVVKLLVAKDTEQNIQGDILFMLQRQNTKVLHIGGEHRTVLDAAWFKRNPDIMRLLLDNGTDPNIQGVCVRVC